MKNKVFKIIETNEDVDEAVDALSNADIVAFDIETTGLNPRKDKVIGHSFCTELGKAFYLPHIIYNNGTILEEPQYIDHQLVRSMLDLLKDKKLLMHNGSFDTRFILESYGINLYDSLYCDTMLIKHTIDETHPFGLKAIAKKIQKHIGLDVDKEANAEQLELAEHLKSIGASQTKDCYELYKGDFRIIGKYACADVDLTYRLYKYYNEKLEQEGLLDFFYKDEVMPLYREVTIPMELFGIPFDGKTCSEYRQDLKVDLLELESKILNTIQPDLDLFHDWFYNKEYPAKRSGPFAQGVCEHYDAPIPRTKAGRYSLKEKNISEMPDCFLKKWLVGETRLDTNTIRSVQVKLHKKAPTFNIYSKDHLKRLFFTKLHLKAISKTPTGKPQVDDAFLKSVEESLPWVSDLLLYNRLYKLKSAYYDRFGDKQEDSWFYPSFNQHRTISGRYGSDVQQLPRPTTTKKDHPLVVKYQNKVRELFISGRGYAFIDADYESLEPHVFAHVSGDEGLRDIFRNGYDFYSTIAISTEKLQGFSANPKDENFLKERDPDKRQKAKTYALGIPYGMGPFKLKFELGVSESEATRLWNAYLNTYPKLKEWMLNSEEDCITKGRVRSEAGRIRHLEEAITIYNKWGKSVLHDLELWQTYHDRPKTYIEAKADRKKLKNYLNNSKNFQIQSLSTSIVNRSALALNRYMKANDISGYVCAQIHDQLIVRVEGKHSEHMRVKTQEIMENTYKLSIKLKAPAEIATNWSEGH